mgnify:CR=1 FL=1
MPTTSTTIDREAVVPALIGTIPSALALATGHRRLAAGLLALAAEAAAEVTEQVAEQVAEPAADQVDAQVDAQVGSDGRASVEQRGRS